MEDTFAQDTVPVEFGIFDIPGDAYDKYTLAKECNCVALVGAIDDESALLTLLQEFDRAPGQVLAHIITKIDLLPWEERDAATKARHDLVKEALAKKDEQKEAQGIEVQDKHLVAGMITQSVSAKDFALTKGQDGAGGMLSMVSFFACKAASISCPPGWQPMVNCQTGWQPIMDCADDKWVTHKCPDFFVALLGGTGQGKTSMAKVLWGNEDGDDHFDEEEEPTIGAHAAIVRVNVAWSPVA